MAALLKPTPSSPQTLNISSHHVQFHHSSPSSLIGSPGTNHNSTPNNHQITPSGSQLQIKKESGALSPVSGSENDGPPSIHQDIFSAKCKRKINFSHFGLPPRNHQPATVARRNARERNRVKQVNNGFAALKQHIPVGHRAKKMSKVETLRCAVDYIRNLQGMLDPRMSGSGTSGREDSEDSHYNRNHPLSDFDSGSYAGQSEQMSPSSSSDPSSPSFAPETSYLHSSTNQHPSTSLYDYENYDPVSPDDEELLDAISIWQQT